MAVVIGGLSVHSHPGLQIEKCVLVSLWTEYADALGSLIRSELARWIPAWKDFKIAGRAVYLGVEVGPAATRGTIRGPASGKWWSRA